MASKQWSGGSYASDATTLIGNIFAHEVSGNILVAGDSFGSNGRTSSTPRISRRRTTARSPASTRGTTGWASSTGATRSCSGVRELRPGPELGQPERRRRHRQQSDGRTLFRLRRLPHAVPGRHGLLPQRRGRAQIYAVLISTFYARSPPPPRWPGSATATRRRARTRAGTLGDYVAGMAFTGPAGVAAMAAGDRPTLRDISYLTVKADTTSNA